MALPVVLEMVSLSGLIFTGPPVSGAAWSKSSTHFTRRPWLHELHGQNQSLIFP